MSAQTEFLAYLDGLTVYTDGVPATPSHPHVVVQSSIPRAAERALTAVRHAESTRWTTTIVGLTSESVFVIAMSLVKRLDGKLIQGQVLKSVSNEQPIIEDRDVVLLGGGHPFYAVLQWQVKTPAFYTQETP